MLSIDLQSQLVVAVLPRFDVPDRLYQWQVTQYADSHAKASQTESSSTTGTIFASMATTSPWSWSRIVAISVFRRACCKDQGRVSGRVGHRPQGVMGTQGAPNLVQDIKPDNLVAHTRAYQHRELAKYGYRRWMTPSSNCPAYTTLPSTVEAEQSQVYRTCTCSAHGCSMEGICSLPVHMFSLVSCTWACLASQGASVVEALLTHWWLWHQSRTSTSQRPLAAVL